GGSRTTGDADETDFQLLCLSECSGCGHGNGQAREGSESHSSHGGKFDHVVSSVSVAHRCHSSAGGHARRSWKYASRELSTLTGKTVYNTVRKMTAAGMLPDRTRQASCQTIRRAHSCIRPQA